MGVAVRATTTTDPVSSEQFIPGNHDVRSGAPRPHVVPCSRPHQGHAGTAVTIAGTRPDTLRVWT